MKKILAMLLSVAIIATIAISGTIAYFTDTESATNVFTVGNVNIELLEQERTLNADGKPDDGALKDFTQGKKLMPIVGSAQGEKDQWGLVTYDAARNYQDKIVRVKNIGDNDAYVRIFVAVPAALESDIGTPALNALHWNVGNRFDATKNSRYNNDDSGNDYKNEFDSFKSLGTQVINSITYNVYSFTRKEALKPGDTSAAAFVGFYLDSKVDYNDVDGKYYLGDKNDSNNVIDFDLSQPVYIPVYAEAVQAAGFDSPDTAFSSAIAPSPSDNPYHPWKDGEMDAVAAVVNSNDAMDEAIKDGATDIVLEKAGTYIIPDSAKGKTLTISGNKNTVVEVQNDGSSEGCDYSFDGSKVTFNGITITTDSHTYAGYARLSATYNNCTINGTYTLNGDSVFNNCTFNVSGDNYNIWTWGAPKAEFNNCIFNCSGKSILLYGGANGTSEGTVTTKLVVKDCIFNDNETLTDCKKAAIETGNDYNATYELIVKNCTVNGFAINDEGTSTGSTTWGNKNSMTTDHLSVTIDGTKVY